MADYQQNRIWCDVTVEHNLLAFRDKLNAIIETIEPGREDQAIITLNGHSIDWQSKDVLDLGRFTDG